MRILVLDTPAEAAAATARLLARTLRETPDAVLGLPTGRTMVPVYQALSRFYHRGSADFSRATTFNLDEFVGLRPSHPGAYRTFMRRCLFDHVNLRRGATHFPASGPRAARGYERAIERAGGLDVCLVGIGSNGHLGFNEPGVSLEPWTHEVRLLPVTRRANAHLFGGRWQDVPATAMSMGIATILQARTVLLIATGEGKRAIVQRALDGPITTRVPASLLQTHPHALAILDAAAARRLAARRR